MGEGKKGKRRNDEEAVQPFSLRLLLGELLSSLLLSTMSYMNPPYRPPNWGHPIYNNTLQEEFECKTIAFSGYGRFSVKQNY